MKWKWAVKAEELIGLSEQGERSVAGSAVDMTRAAYTEGQSIWLWRAATPPRPSLKFRGLGANSSLFNLS